MHDRSGPQDWLSRRFGGNVIGLSRRFRRASLALFRTPPLPPHTTVTMVRAAPRARPPGIPTPVASVSSARSRHDRKASRTRRRLSTLFVDRDRPRTPRASSETAVPSFLHVRLRRRLRLCHATRERLNDAGSTLESGGLAGVLLMGNPLLDISRLSPRSSSTSTALSSTTRSSPRTSTRPCTRT